MCANTHSRTALIFHWKTSFVANAKCQLAISFGFWTHIYRRQVGLISQTCDVIQFSRGGLPMQVTTKCQGMAHGEKVLWQKNDNVRECCGKISLHGILICCIFFTTITLYRNSEYFHFLENFCNLQYSRCCTQQTICHSSHLRSHCWKCAATFKRDTFTFLQVEHRAMLSSAPECVAQEH